ncbi:MAG: phosphodiester glycosidase family protein, partial [Akkermansiaceae bacterium]|nr:phosphodiester glycosidase family protein [Akkermansiaceae bacterium]
RGPETEWQSARAAAQQHDAVAAINAAFFTPEGQPLGLVIENGVRFGAWNRASSLTSGVLVVGRGRPRLLRREGWPLSSEAEQLVQAGPLLLENAGAVPGLSTNPARPRSFLAWDNRHHWAIGFTRSATLAELASALASQPVPGTRFSTALNLDGGRSSDLWVSSTIKGGPVSTRRFWNNPVRNYVLIRKRPQP